MPSQADVAVFDALKGKAPAKDAYPHAARWYAHIASFEAGGRKQFPKSQKDAASYVSGGKICFKSVSHFSGESLSNLAHSYDVFDLKFE